MSCQKIWTFKHIELWIQKMDILAEHCLCILHTRRKTHCGCDKHQVSLPPSLPKCPLRTLWSCTVLSIHTQDILALIQPKIKLHIMCAHTVYQAIAGWLGDILSEGTYRAVLSFQMTANRKPGCSRAKWREASDAWFIVVGMNSVM